MGLFARDLRAHEFPLGARWLNVDHPITLADLRGKVVLLDFWTYCCINCMHVIPDLKRLEAKYPELVVIGVHSAKFANERGVDNIRHAILRYGIEHPVVVDNDFQLWQAYGIHAWPSFVLVDPAGNVAGQASGEGPYSMFDDAIASLSAAFGEQGLLDREPFSLDLVKERAPGSALSYPGKIEVDPKGRRLFVSDSNHNRVVVLKPDGEVTDVIGSGREGASDGGFETAEFLRPQGMAYDPDDDALYVADTENHLVRRVDLGAGTVSTVLGEGHQGGYARGGRGTDLAINSPWDLTVMGEHLYIAMAGPHQLWRMDLRTGEAEVYAGSGREDIVDGPRERAALAQPSGIDTDGDRILFADSEVSAVRMVENDRVRTLVGAGLFDFGDVDGPLGAARLQHPIGLRHHGGRVLVADTYNHKVRVIDPARGTVSTLVGTGESGNADGPGRKAMLSEPNDVAVMDGVVYIADTNNHLVRTYDPGTDTLTTLRFANEERLWPRSGRAFRGTVRTLPPVTVGQGRLEVRFRLSPPAGHRWNADAPNRLDVLSDDETLKVLPLLVDDWGWDYPIPVEATGPGSTNLRLRVIAYFCGEGDADLCRFSALELVLPVVVIAKGDAAVEVNFQLEIE